MDSKSVLQQTWDKVLVQAEDGDDRIKKIDNVRHVFRVEMNIDFHLKMDEEAVAGGHKPLKPSIWSYTTQDGFKFAVAQGNADAIKAIRTDPAMEGVAVYSLDEIGRILENESMRLVNSAKNTFPEAKITSAKTSGKPPF